MSDDVFPLSYGQWRHCIELRCKIRLTPMYIDERLAELQDNMDARTREFSRLYGADQLQRTITWFRRAGDEMTEDRK